jgi:hypothetical protein
LNKKESKDISAKLTSRLDPANPLNKEYSISG